MGILQMASGKKWESGLDAELRKLQKRELRKMKQAKKERSNGLLLRVEEKIPHKVLSGLKKAFRKVFFLVFSKGAGVIEKTFDKDVLQKDYAVRNYAVDLKGGKKEIRQFGKDIKIQTMKNMAVSAAEGVGLGALGIGLPDIALFVGMLLKGVYETSLKYGFCYETQEEQTFILKLLEASVSKGDDWTRLNFEIDSFIEEEIHTVPSEAEWNRQVERTADAFAAELLVMKFIQGLPVVGIIGGMGNPVYYRKIMDYIQLKYKKRYLTVKIREKAQTVSKQN